MVNINCLQDSDRGKFITDVLGAPHMTVYQNGKKVAIWYVTEDDKKVLEEMEKENAKA